MDSHPQPSSPDSELPTPTPQPPLKKPSSRLYAVAASCVLLVLLGTSTALVRTRHSAQPSPSSEQAKASFSPLPPATCPDKLNADELKAVWHNVTYSLDSQSLSYVQANCPLLAAQTPVPTTSVTPTATPAAPPSQSATSSPSSTQPTPGKLAQPDRKSVV